jgi:DNA-binding NtrC family response regulator
VRQLRNLIESMVVLAPEGEIRAADIPRDIRERGAGRGLPVRVASTSRDVAGQEVEFILRSLVELKLQIEELRRRIEERPAQRVEVIEVGGGPQDPLLAEPVPEEGEGGGGAVIYRSGMTMADVERAAIEATLKDTRGNRRKAAEVLGIGERTLYRKLKEYQLA